MSDYNGWANWETWNTALWLGNDEGLYREAKRQWSAGDGAQARELVERLMPTGTPDMDGTDGGYSAVDWPSIAECLDDL